MIHFDLPKEKSSILKVIGVGGGGGNAVNFMFNQQIDGDCPGLRTRVGRDERGAWCWRGRDGVRPRSRGRGVMRAAWTAGGRGEGWRHGR